MASGPQTSEWPYMPPHNPARWLALGIHAGLLLVCFGAIYTRQLGNFSMLRWAGIALLGFALLVSAAATRGRVALTRWGRLSLGLGAGVLLTLAYEPQLADMPLLAGTGIAGLANLEPSVGTVGVGLVLVFWLLFEFAGGELGLAPAPFRRSILGVGGLLSGLALVMYVVLSSVESVASGDPTRFVVFTVVQYILLLAGVVSSSGGPGVRGWMHFYVAAALLAVVARNLLAGGEVLW